VRLLFTPEAEFQVTEMDTWWREHRPAARDLFARELAEARTMVLSARGAGVKYTTKSGKVVRRVFMPKTKNHLYFEVDDTQQLIIVLAVWGAPRGRYPDL
jgi:hypothetical protein